MTPFVRFIFGVTFLACLLAVSIVLASNHYSVREQNRRLSIERDRARELFTGQAKYIRRADLVVESQTISGTGDVIETNIIFRPWIRTSREREVELSIQRMTIPGDTVTIDGQIVWFKRNYIENVDFLAGMSIPMFAHIYGEGQKPGPENLLAPSFSCASPLVDANSVSTYELRIWSAIRDARMNPAAAEEDGVLIQNKTPASRVLRPGVAYRVWLGSAIGVGIDEQTDRPQIVKELLAKAQALDALAATQPGVLRD